MMKKQICILNMSWNINSRVAPIAVYEFPPPYWFMKIKRSCCRCFKPNVTYFYNSQYALTIQFVCIYLYSSNQLCSPQINSPPLKIIHPEIGSTIFCQSSINSSWCIVVALGAALRCVFPISEVAYMACIGTTIQQQVNVVTYKGIVLTSFTSSEVTLYSLI